jgi:hypothetical protein
VQEIRPRGSRCAAADARQVGGTAKLPRRTHRVSMRAAEQAAWVLPEFLDARSPACVPDMGLPHWLAEQGKGALLDLRVGETLEVSGCLRQIL